MSDVEDAYDGLQRSMFRAEQMTRKVESHWREVAFWEARLVEVLPEGPERTAAHLGLAVAQENVQTLVAMMAKPEVPR